MHDFR